MDPFAICPPLNVTFINTSTGATNYNWSLGDGTHSVATSPGDIYEISRIDTGDPGSDQFIRMQRHSYRARFNIRIYGCGFLRYTPVSGCSPLSVHFSAAITGSSNIIWDFNDGTTALSVADTISHTYHTAGSYVPKPLILLIDATGCSSFQPGR